VEFIMLTITIAFLVIMAIFFYVEHRFIAANQRSAEYADRCISDHIYEATILAQGKA
jgi:hypothetical protein